MFVSSNKKYTSKEDEQLMVLIQGGDHRAFSALFDRYAGRLKAFFHRMLWSDGEMAEDYVQDLFTKIIDRPELFKTGMKFKPWVFQVASNMCKNAYRKKSFETAYLDQLEGSGIQLPSIERELDEKVKVDQIYLFLKSLDEEKRELFVMRYQQEMSIKEIADICEVKEGTVKSRLHYLRNALIVFMDLENEVNVDKNKVIKDHGTKL